MAGLVKCAECRYLVVRITNDQSEVCAPNDLRDHGRLNTRVYDKLPFCSLKKQLRDEDFGTVGEEDSERYNVNRKGPLNELRGCSDFKKWEGERTPEEARARERAASAESEQAKLAKDDEWKRAWLSAALPILVPILVAVIVWVFGWLFHLS